MSSLQKITLSHRTACAVSAMLVDLDVPVSRLVRHQIGNLFLLDADRDGPVLDQAVDEALARCSVTFSAIGNKYYRRGDDLYFNPFHSGQYVIFLYHLSRVLHGLGPSARLLADRVYYLNRALNGLDLYYEVALPEIFFLDHPLGTVLGRASYGSHFFFAQNCTVGNNHGVYPRFGEHVTMLSGAKVVGNCSIGSNVILSANTYVKDQDIPGNSIVFGSSPSLVIKHRDDAFFSEHAATMFRADARIPDKTH